MDIEEIQKDESRKVFEAYRDERNSRLESEGHKPDSKWHVTNAHYPTWEASRSATEAELQPAWRPMSEDPPFPFTGDIFVAGQVVIGAVWCAGCWQMPYRGSVDRSDVTNWKPRNKPIAPPAAQ